MDRYKTYTSAFTYRPALRTKDEEDEMSQIINCINSETKKILEKYEAYKYLDELKFDFSKDERRL